MRGIFGEALREYRENFSKIIGMQVVCVILLMFPFMLSDINRTLASITGVFILSVVSPASLIFYKNIRENSISGSFLDVLKGKAWKYLVFTAVFLLSLLGIFYLSYDSLLAILKGKANKKALLNISASFLTALIITSFFIYPQAVVVEKGDIFQAFIYLKRPKYFRSGISFTVISLLLLIPFIYLSLLPRIGIFFFLLISFFVVPYLSILYWKMYPGGKR